MELRRVVSTFALTAAIVVGARAETAQRTFVSAGSGLDTNPCSRSAPCRNFAAAIAHTSANGEVVALDSGGYGPVSITQPVTIEAPPAVIAGITAFSGSAVYVGVGSTDHVGLHGLTINAFGAWGITGDFGGSLDVENCFVVHATYGMSTSVPFVVKDSTFLNCSSGGIQVSNAGATATASPINGVIEHCRFEGNGAGMGAGVEAANVSRVTIRDSVITRYPNAVYAYAQAVDTTSDVNIDSSLLATNSVGIIAGAGATVRVSRSTITQNGTGLVLSDPTGNIVTRSNNSLIDNGTNGTFTGTFTPQ